MPRDKYVHLSDGRTLKVYKGADGSEYYKDKEEKKTLRSNQKTIFKDSAKAEEGKAPVNVAVRRVSALPSPAKAEFEHLSNDRQLKVYTRDDGTKYYNDGGRKTLRSNQHVVRDTSKDGLKKEAPSLKQASKTGRRLGQLWSSLKAIGNDATLVGILAKTESLQSPEWCHASMALREPDPMDI